MSNIAHFARVTNELSPWTPAYERATHIFAFLAKERRFKQIVNAEAVRNSNLIEGSLPPGRLYGDTMTAKDRMSRIRRRD